MDLFSFSNGPSKYAPLAEKMRPKTISEVLGQSEIVGPNSLLIKLLSQGVLPNTILWGPPGTGKTTLARIIASTLEAELFLENATDLGAKEIREIGASAQSRRQVHGRQTVVFVDEIHRLNKSQQDNLLPFIEKGDFTLIGATTENPSFELNSALLSRCHVFILKLLGKNDLNKLLQKATTHFSVEPDKVFSPEAIEQICELAQGDGRSLINMVEGILNFYKGDHLIDVEREVHFWPIKAGSLNQVLGSRLGYYDKKGDGHYDTISAFIKSMRGSNVSAALYYLARMIKFGEDPKFIARRLVVFASEDIVSCDPLALSLAISGFQAVEYVGLPEAAINLAHVVTYLSKAPKSKQSYNALIAAQLEVERTGALPIPEYLRHGSPQPNPDQGDFFPRNVTNKIY